MEYNVVVAPRVERDLNEIYNYTIVESPVAAKRWLSSVLEELARLRGFPRTYPLAPENAWFDGELRQMIVGRYRVIFSLVQEDAEVHVLHVRHSSRRPAGRDIFRADP